MDIIPKRFRKNKEEQEQKNKRCLKEKLAEADKLLEDVTIDWSQFLKEEEDTDASSR